MPFEITMGNEYRVDVSGTSEGTQVKYKKDGAWYKEDFYGGEGNAEELASILLSCSSLSAEEYVAYEAGRINGKSGCRCQDFLHDGETFVTLYRYFEYAEGLHLNEYLLQFDTPEERIEYVLRYFEKNCGVDLFAYFRKVFTLDLIIRNEDRHLNNLGIIRMRNGGYREAPIFDNGKSLFVGNVSVSRHFTMAENIQRTVARSFSGSFEKQQEYFGDGFTVDISKCLSRIEDFPECREKMVLRFQVEQMQVKI